MTKLQKNEISATGQPFLHSGGYRKKNIKIKNNSQKLIFKMKIKHISCATKNLELRTVRRNLIDEPISWKRSKSVYEKNKRIQRLYERR